MQKFKLLFTLLAIWGSIFIFLLVLAVFRDIQTNKLFNYSEVYSQAATQEHMDLQTHSLKYAFTLTAHNNYLGSIFLRHYPYENLSGQIVFRVKKATQNDWYAVNHYDISYFNDYNYQFGFPAIADSKGTQFNIEFEIDSPDISQNLNSLDLRTPPVLLLKYVFPQSAFYQSPETLATILVNRSKTVLTGTNLIDFGLESFAVALFIFIVAHRQKDWVKWQLANHNTAFQQDLQHIGSWVSRINPFYVPGGVFVILIVVFVLGNFSLAEHLAEYLWITLLASAILFILQITVFTKLNKLWQSVDVFCENLILTLDELMKGKTLLVLCILLIVVLGLSSTYYLGGDDTRLFYLYPKEYLQNYASKIVSDTGLSQLANSIPPTSLGAFMVILIILRTILPFFNLQSLLNSANLIGGVFAFFFLIKYLLHPSGKYERVICLLTSFIYVFSIFNFYTLLNSRLETEYLISLFPLTLYLGIKSIREGKFYLFAAVVVIWSALDFVSVSVPLSAAALITTLPLLIYSTWENKTRLVKHLISGCLLFLVLNLHWLIYVPYTNFAQNIPGANTPSITSTEFRKLNESGIKMVSEINSSFFPLLNSYHQAVQFNFNWPQLPIYISWYSKFLIFGYVLIATVILAGVWIDKNKQRSGLYIAAVLNFVLAVYFFTVNISPWGVSVFLWLSDHVPGFVIFRNMYDKFAYALALQWALVLAVSLAIVLKAIKIDKYKVYLLSTVFLIAILNAKPYILGEFTNLPYWTTKYSHDGIKGFNRNYLDLLSFVKNQDSQGRYLSLPLLTGNSVIVPDESWKDHYYAGPSPLLLLTGKNDMSGLISFSTNATQVYDWLKDKDFDSFGYLLQQYNVRYVIVDNSVSSDLQGSFMFSDGLFYLQTKDFFTSLIGNKIRDFGTQYSLYDINPRFKSEKIYLSDNPESFANEGSQLSFKKMATQSYNIHISELNGHENLVFLDPFLKQWQLLTSSGKQVLSDNHKLVFGYANLWQIDPQVVKSTFPKSDYNILPDGSVSLQLRLYFQPYNYFILVNGISISAYLLCIIFILVSLVKTKGK